MKVDGGVSNELGKAAASAKETEAAGYDGAWSVETAHDPFMPLLLAAEHTDHLELGTSIAVAFARNPMTLANIGWDLQAFSKGRFILGLGSQIKPHITKRFSMEWSHPAPRMREMILAIRAIWDTWQNGTPLAFRGEFYTHTLMTPFFTPNRGDLDGFGVPRIFLAGVGEFMTEVAGEVCDGFICHGFTTERYLREVTLPALARGRAKAGKSMEGFEIVGPSFVVTGNNDEEFEAADVGHTPADRVLRIDACLQGRARTPRLGGTARGAQRALEEGWLGGDGQPHHRRHPQHVRSGRRTRADCAGVAPPVRRRGPAHQLLRPVQEQPRPLAQRPRRPPGILNECFEPARGGRKHSDGA